MRLQPVVRAAYRLLLALCATTRCTQCFQTAMQWGKQLVRALHLLQGPAALVTKAQWLPTAVGSR